MHFQSTKKDGNEHAATSAAKRNKCEQHAKRNVFKLNDSMCIMRNLQPEEEKQTTCLVRKENGEFHGHVLLKLSDEMRKMLLSYMYGMSKEQ